MSDAGLRKHIAIPVQYNEPYFARWSFADGYNKFHCYCEFYPHAYHTFKIFASFRRSSSTIKRVLSGHPRGRI